jgi:hypothetical protein
MRAGVAILMASTLLTACGPSGSGNLVTEAREVGEFTSLEVSGGIDLRLTVDPSATTSVSVIYDDNLLDRIVTEVDGDTLTVRSRGPFNVFGSGRIVEVTTPTLQSLTASGGSDVDGTGATESLAVEVSGGADLDLGDLVAGTVVLRASGGADVTVNVTDEISGEASGGADVTVRGDPVNQSIDVSGGADVGTG